MCPQPVFGSGAGIGANGRWIVIRSARDDTRAQNFDQPARTGSLK